MRLSRNDRPAGEQVRLEDAAAVAVVERQGDQGAVRRREAEVLDDRPACSRRRCGTSARRRAGVPVLPEVYRTSAGQSGEARAPGAEGPQRAPGRRGRPRGAASPATPPSALPNARRDGAARCTTQTVVDRAPRQRRAPASGRRGPRRRPGAPGSSVTMSPRTSALHSRFTSTEVAPSAFSGEARDDRRRACWGARAGRGCPGRSPAPRGGRRGREPGPPARRRTGAPSGWRSPVHRGARSAWKKSQSGRKALPGRGRSATPRPAGGRCSITNVRPSSG